MTKAEKNQVSRNLTHTHKQKNVYQPTAERQKFNTHTHTYIQKNVYQPTADSVSQLAVTWRNMCHRTG